ncbi:Mpo1-like protein [Chryseobacterium sp.]|uniref:Mpo1 family 2-hydroxy fatty acid dioxygenase n=1 Tax=Chryseobacterium sp. TaxID=1871047 RepID=UPI0025C4DD35|nr:Mpo1-like protein [Chryseobacterium sp.]
MRKIDLFFAEYGESHRNVTNKSIHWICVPLIFWTILGFISLIPSPHFCASYFGCISIVSIIAIAVVTLFYLRLSLLVSIIMLFIMLIMESLAYAVNIRFEKNAWLVYLAVFIITWIFQFIGHKIEGKKPSFLKDLQFLLIGPIWLLGFILKKLGVRY